VPGPTITPFAPLARAAHLRRASFLAHQLWVTPFAEDENYPGGDWPNQVRGTTTKRTAAPRFSPVSIG
jgi:primary-amine oxidase